MIGENLLRILEEKGISVSKFAEQMFVCKTTAYNWIYDRTDPPLWRFVDMCKVLNVTYDELLKEVEDEF